MPFTNYTDIQLLKRGNLSDGFQYAIPLYSGNKRLIMMIDTGAHLSHIGNIPLKGCSYHNTRQKVRVFGIAGDCMARKVLLDFYLSKPEDSNNESPFSLDFLVIAKKDSSYLNSENVDGLLGTNFLQFCDVNFLEGYIRVYHP